MRSGGSAHPLARRLARLARHIPVDRAAEWRAYLAEYFAAGEYDAVRGELIAALCSARPGFYGFGLASDATHDGQPCAYLISWCDRAEGRPPVVHQVVGVPYDAI